MGSQVLLPQARFPAGFTHVRPFTGMRHLVSSQMAIFAKAPRTLWARERFFAVMRPDVVGQVTLALIHFAAHLTHESARLDTAFFRHAVGTKSCWYQRAPTVAI